MIPNLLAADVAWEAHEAELDPVTPENLLLEDIFLLVVKPLKYGKEKKIKMLNETKLMVFVNLLGKRAWFSLSCVCLHFLPGNPEGRVSFPF